MTKYRVAGPDAEAFLNRLTLRDVSKLAIGRVQYTAWCDDEGHVLDDGTLFRLGRDTFRLCCQERHLPWLLDGAARYDVTIADETEEIAGLSLQRASVSFALLRSAGFAGIETLKPFELRAVPHDRGEVVVSRTGFTGDLGYELFCPAEAALSLWDRLAGHGEPVPAAGDRLFGAEPGAHRGGLHRRQRRFHHRRTPRCAKIGCAFPTRLASNG